MKYIYGQPTVFGVGSLYPGARKASGTMWSDCKVFSNTRSVLLVQVVMRRLSEKK